METIRSSGRTLCKTKYRPKKHLFLSKQEIEDNKEYIRTLQSLLYNHLLDKNRVQNIDEFDAIIQHNKNDFDLSNKQIEKILAIQKIKQRKDKLQLQKLLKTGSLEEFNQEYRIMESRYRDNNDREHFIKEHYKLLRTKLFTCGSRSRRKSGSNSGSNSCRNSLKLYFSTNRSSSL